jgi:crotonobetainyl-CoA:carnitine CoA-transferase CaiB-like acyl-CoA transferase
MDDLLRTRSTDDWLARLIPHGIPCAPVNDIAAALGDTQALARDAIGSLEHPRLGHVRQVRTPFHMRGVDRGLRPAPALGEHTEAIMRELGRTKTVGHP